MTNGILDYFMVSPGDRKRKELEEQLRERALAAAAEQQIRQQKAIQSSAMENAETMHNRAEDKRISALFHTYMNEHPVSNVEGSETRRVMEEINQNEARRFALAENERIKAAEPLAKSTEDFNRYLAAAESKPLVGEQGTTKTRADIDINKAHSGLMGNVLTGTKAIANLITGTERAKKLAERSQASLTGETAMEELNAGIPAIVAAQKAAELANKTTSSGYQTMVTGKLQPGMEAEALNAKMAAEKKRAEFGSEHPEYMFPGVFGAQSVLQRPTTETEEMAAALSPEGPRSKSQLLGTSVVGPTSAMPIQIAPGLIAPINVRTNAIPNLNQMLKVRSQQGR